MRGPRRFAGCGRARCGLAGLALASVLTGSLASRAAELESPGASEPVCAEGQTLATGAADPTIVAREASRGVQAFWCETYGTDGAAHRAGPYQDRHANGQTRVRAQYVESRLEGPVEIYDEEGALWLRGQLVAGEWSGELALFHANGQPWFVARFEGGRIAGPVQMRRPDGSLEMQADRNERTEVHAAR